MKQIEQTKVNSKKRKGVAHFIKYFSSYVSRVENQLVGAEGLEVRSLVDAAYERIVKGMFDALKHMAKMEGEGEDKGQLNYHILLIGMCPRHTCAFTLTLASQKTCTIL